MASRVGRTLLRRCFSASPRLNAAEKLPFEKPIYESELLSKAMAERESRKRLEHYGNLVVIAVGLSVVARMGYYVVYGKESGALPLPRRDCS